MKLEKCIGCQGCVEACPYNAIDFSYNIWGEGHAVIDADKCKDCGLCERICPLSNILFNEAATTVYAVISKKGPALPVLFRSAFRALGDALRYRFAMIEMAAGASSRPTMYYR